MAATAEDKALSETLRQWQELEDEIVGRIDAMLEKVRSPLVRAMLEAIQHDSRLHKHMQQIVLDSLEKKPMAVPAEEVEQLWVSLDQHAELERRAIGLAETIVDATGGETRHVAHHYLISYLLDDEKKHEKILGSLALLRQQLPG